MNCIIVDDNKIARETLKQLCKHAKNMVVRAVFENAVEAFNYLQGQHDTDLILLDVEMPEMTGLQLVQHLPHPQPLIIFTTAKKDYAAEAYDLNVVDYLVKPIEPPRFLNAVAKATDILNTAKDKFDVAGQDIIFIRDSNIVRKLKLDDILFAEAMGDYVKIHTLSKFYAVHTTLKEVEARLPAHNFIKVHRTYIVALDKIDTLQEGVITIRNTAIPVADAYRGALNKRMNIL